MRKEVRKTQLNSFHRVFPTALPANRRPVLLSILSGFQLKNAEKSPKSYAKVQINPRVEQMFMIATLFFLTSFTHYLLYTSMSFTCFITFNNIPFKYIIFKHGLNL